MRNLSFKSIQIGNIQDFKKMLADAIANKESCDRTNPLPSKFSYNDQYYMFNSSSMIDLVES